MFVTIDKINPINVTTSKETTKKSELDNSLEKSLSNLFFREKDIEAPPKHEEIVTKYGEYPNMSNKSTIYLRNSLSLQDILDVDKSTNSNNDFDNNSLVPPDKTYLIQESGSKKKFKNKSELNLIDIIGSSSHDNREKNGESSGTSRRMNGSETVKYGKNRGAVLENGTSPTAKNKNGADLRNGSSSKSEYYRLI